MSTHAQNAQGGVLGMLKKIVSSESFSGIFLFLCAVLAMIVANSPLGDAYRALWHFHWGFSWGSTPIELSMEHWINDVLMSFFFLVVGLEIKYELIYGALASFKKAAFPVLAAIGGMVVPGLIYYALNAGTPSENGFGIPMATDIAFALGVMLMLGSRVPVALKVFLVTLAVADDLGAIIVIAIFYTTNLQLEYLGVAVAILVFLVILGKLGVRSLVPYLVLGVPLWLAVHACGVHATIAAVALAFTIPAGSKLAVADYFKKSAHDIKEMQDEDKNRDRDILSDDQAHTVAHLIKHSQQVQSPMVRLQHALHPWSSYLIMPLFAFANAGVEIGDSVRFDVDNILLGIACGLIIGKPVGIFLATFLCEKLGIAERPDGVSWIDILGAGMLAGIGFTMSIFVTMLAFKGLDPSIMQESVDLAKLTILCSSLTAGILGALFLILESKFTKH